MRFSILWPAIPWVLVAQQSARPEDLCAIEGRVANAASGAPVRKATVLITRTAALSGAALPTTFSTTTGASGEYAMKNIEPGQYRMTVRRDGFVTTAYGAKRAGGQGTILSLERGQSLKDVNLRLTPDGVVTGRIVDEDGEPMVYVMVQLLRPAWRQGKREMMPAGNAQTNDLGEYRIFGAAPGQYYVWANPRVAMMRMPQTEDRSASPPAEEGYASLYYPGTPDADAAARIEVTGGGTVAGVNMTLTKIRTVHIKGHVTDNAAGTRPPMRILAMPRNSTLGIAAPATQNTDSKGDFDLRGVAPGPYWLYAMVSSDSNRQYSGRIPIEVGNSNLENVNLAIGPGTTVSGTVRVEDRPPGDLSRINVHLSLKEFSGMAFGPPASGPLKDGGVFELFSTSADVFNVLVTGLPDGSYLKAVQAGDIDVLAGGLDLTRGAPPPLEIVISPNAGLVSGAVHDADTGQAAPGATVALIPEAQERKGRQEYYRVTASDQNGSYTVKNLVPGEYRAFAFEDIEPGAYMDPDWMKAFESKGEAVTIREGDRKAVALKLIPAEETATGQR